MGVEGVNAERGPLFHNTYMALEAAAAGHGVALAPAPMVDRDLATGKLVKPLAMEMDNPYAFWIVYPHHLRRDSRVQAFVHWIKGCD